MTDVRIATMDGTGKVLESAAVQAFRDELRGPLIGPEDANYDETRRVWNGMIDRRPALIARAEGGATWSEFDRETQAFGLATTGGAISHTGIGGLTLGGGLGWLAGKYGLVCDNLLSVDLITAEGTVLIVSPTENAELFWGLRGGGGNFGVVTSFEYQLHLVGPV